MINSKTAREKSEDTYILTKGTETILIAEDDTQIRELKKHVLINAGYEVIEADDGERAISSFYESKDRIQLLILDVVMPRKNGKTSYKGVKVKIR